MQCFGSQTKQVFSHKETLLDCAIERALAWICSRAQTGPALKGNCLVAPPCWQGSCATGVGGECWFKINCLAWEPGLQMKWADVPWCRTSLGGSADQGSPGLLHRGCWALQERHGAVSAWNTKMFVQLKPLSKSSFCGFFTHLGPHGIKLCPYFRAELSCPSSGSPSSVQGQDLHLFVHQRLCHTSFTSECLSCQAWAHPGPARVSQNLADEGQTQRRELDPAQA